MRKGSSVEPSRASVDRTSGGAGRVMTVGSAAGGAKRGPRKSGAPEHGRAGRALRPRSVRTRATRTGMAGPCSAGDSRWLALALACLATRVPALMRHNFQPLIVARQPYLASPHSAARSPPPCPGKPPPPLLPPSLGSFLTFFLPSEPHPDQRLVGGSFVMASVLRPRSDKEHDAEHQWRCTVMASRVPLPRLFLPLPGHA